MTYYPTIREIALAKARERAANLSLSKASREHYLRVVRDLERETAPICDMGVGCQEAGMCYAVAHGQPERCPL